MFSCEALLNNTPIEVWIEPVTIYNITDGQTVDSAEFDVDTVGYTNDEFGIRHAMAFKLVGALFDSNPEGIVTFLAIYFTMTRINRTSRWGLRLSAARSPTTGPCFFLILFFYEKLVANIGSKLQSISICITYILHQAYYFFLI